LGVREGVMVQEPGLHHTQRLFLQILNLFNISDCFYYIYKSKMKKTVLLIFDKFKDTLSSEKVCKVVASALEREGVEIKSVPISDGGDDFVDCMHHVLKD